MTLQLNRRQFFKLTSAGVLVLYVGTGPGGTPRAVAAAPVAVLDHDAIPKFVTPLLIPPVMPRARRLVQRGGKNVDVYEISVRQFRQQILPGSLPKTTVWGYGALASESRRGVLAHHAPSFTIEAQVGRPVRVRWVNELVDADGHHLPHLLPVDPTLHWANPPGGVHDRDTRPHHESTPGAYTGPVPLVTHVHGAVGVADDSDGYTEAWYLPAADDIPDGYATEGTWYDFFRDKAEDAYGVTWAPGEATFQYPNDNRASTLWYHDHALGLTRLNVYAGPAGFWILRGGPAGDDAITDTRTGRPAVLPGPAPRANDGFPTTKEYREIPLGIQDRSFHTDGSLFYPDTRAFFDGITEHYLPHGEFSPIWNPEFFGSTLIVNGATWPTHTVARARYRFRVLNGCQSRFLVLDFSRIPGVGVWQIGNEGGLLAEPVDVTGRRGNHLGLGPAERADIIVDFTGVAPGSYVLANVGPDEPYGGGVPGVDFEPADPDSTGKILQFVVVPATSADPSTPPAFLRLPRIAALPAPTTTRRLALIELMGMGMDAEGHEVEGPVAALLGTLDAAGVARPHEWAEPVTENPAVGATEVWEIYNTTGDAHPIHVHEVTFEVVNRQGVTLEELGEDAEGGGVRVTGLRGDPRPPEPGERGRKDTVMAFPGEVTRIKATFGVAGQYVWHCHIVEHEDNEMMRPFRIGPVQLGQPLPGPH